MQRASSHKYASCKLGSRQGIRRLLDLASTWKAFCSNVIFGIAFDKEVKQTHACSNDFRPVEVEFEFKLIDLWLETFVYAILGFRRHRPITSL